MSPKGPAPGGRLPGGYRPFVGVRLPPKMPPKICGNFERMPPGPNIPGWRGGGIGYEGGGAGGSIGGGLGGGTTSSGLIGSGFFSPRLVGRRGVLAGFPL